VTAVPAPAARPRVLFVDDEPAILESIAANLRRGFEILTAPSGAAGLEMLKADPTISVVVSDMRMPQMNGATFLARAREVAPMTVRMLLTGQADLASAIEAVNNGQIYRFLTKPCPRDTLRETVESAVEQYRLHSVEREMLEHTVRGSVRMMFDVLALTSPAAFGRGNRLKRRVLELAAVLGVTETWHLEVAALSSQLGYASLSHELTERIARGDILTEDERAQLDRAPEVALKLLASIPRLDAVRDVLAAYVHPPRRIGTAWRSSSELGAHLLRFAIDIDELEGPSGVPLDIRTIKTRLVGADLEVMGAYEKLRGAAASASAKDVALSALRVGMVLAEDVRLLSGAMLVARGYEITVQFLDRVKGFPPGTLWPTLKVLTV